MGLIDKLNAIGDAIREKNGTSELIPLEDMPQAIRDIKSGGGVTVEYIESTGTQYIDTGYIANQNTRIECKYQIIGKNGDYDNLFGDFACISYSHIYNDEKNTGYQMVKWGGEIISYGNALLSSDITILELANGIFTFTENGVTTTKTVGADAEFTSPYSLLLFCNRYYKNVSQYEAATCCKARVYYFKIFESDVLVRDFVSAIDKNGVFCLFDRVTGTYFYNQGTGAFKGGFTVLNGWC